jgi:hypothetical protein
MAPVFGERLTGIDENFKKNLKVLDELFENY